MIIDGFKVSSEIKEQLKNEILELNIKPNLTVIRVGNDEASKIYVNNKAKACAAVGINSNVIELDEQTTEQQLLDTISSLNNSENVNGILLQLPIPKHINAEKALLQIDPKKDVDGLHPYNAGLLWVTDIPVLKPCTPYGVMELIKRTGIKTEGANCVIVGRSNLVGKPLATLLLKANATVTICHSKTKNLDEVCQNADILIAAIGKPKFIKEHMVKEGAVVIDVGINRLEGKTICGDVDFENVKDKASFITPVPKGVGPMTVAMLLKNCVEAYKIQNRI